MKFEDGKYEVVFDERGTQQQEEYMELLSTMDWWYARSDDHSVYTKGKMQWERICQLMKIVDKDRLIYKSYVKGK